MYMLVEVARKRARYFLYSPGISVYNSPMICSPAQSFVYQTDVSFTSPFRLPAQPSAYQLDFCSPARYFSFTSPIFRLPARSSVYRTQETDHGTRGPNQR